MKLNLAQFLTVFLGLTMTIQAYSQGEYYVRNLSYIYDTESELRFDCQAFTIDSTITVFGQVSINETYTKLDDIVFQYGFVEDYKKDMMLSEDTLKSEVPLFSNLSSRHNVKFTIPNPDGYPTLIIRLYNQITNNDFLFDIPLSNEEGGYNPEIIISNSKSRKVLISNFLKTGQTINVSAPETDQISGFAYFEEFNIARPPMAPLDDNIAKNIKIDSSFSLSSTDTITLKQEGLFFFQADTSKLAGTGRRIVDPYFPKAAKISQLIEALTYISSGNELNDIRNSGDQKKAFDGFWLENTQDRNRAGITIRKYYRRYSEANELFTSYKDGWKTDMGMIYMIFGLPDEVYRRDDAEEEWVYYRKSNLPAVNFTFLRVNSIFSNKHYLLLRKKSYQNIWFEAVDNWRKGRAE